MVTSSNKHAPLGIFGGVLTIGFILLTSFYGAVFIYGPILPLMFLWPWLFRRLAEMLASTWQTLLVALYEKVHGVKVVVSGDSIDRHEKTVVLMNHRTRIDWMYFFPVVFHMKILNRQKIALKSILKWIPGVGWAMQVAAYIFLDRNWETDQHHIDRILSYFVELDSKPNILFFPEGTDLSEDNKRKSQEFAKKNDLPIFEHVLQPRTKGFTYFVNTLRNISGIHAVHDVTLAYPYNIPVGEKEMLMGEVPREVHFNIKRYDIEDLPKEESELAKWCQHRWAEKEKLLEEFYSEPDSSARKFKSNKKPPYHARDGVLWLAFALWLFLATIFTYLMLFYPFARLYSLLLTSFYIAESYLVGGFPKMEMLLYEMFQVSRDKWGMKNKDRYGASGDHSDKVGSTYDKYLNDSDS